MLDQNQIIGFARDPDVCTKAGSSDTDNGILNFTYLHIFSPDILS